MDEKIDRVRARLIEIRGAANLADDTSVSSESSLSDRALAYVAPHAPWLALGLLGGVVVGWIAGRKVEAAEQWVGRKYDAVTGAVSGAVHSVGEAAGSVGRRAAGLLHRSPAGS